MHLGYVCLYVCLSGSVTIAPNDLNCLHKKYYNHAVYDDPVKNSSPLVNRTNYSITAELVYD